MKNITFFLIFLFLFIGCGGSVSQNSQNDNNNTQNTLIQLPLISEFRIEGGIHEEALFDHFVFCANSNGLRVIDIQDLYHLEEIAHIDIFDGEYTPYDIVISKDGDKAYVVGALYALFSRSFTPLQFLAVIDISDRYHPVVLGSMILDSIAWGVKLSADGTKAFIASGSEFSSKYPANILIADITDSSEPKLITSFELNSIAYGLALSKNDRFVYTAEGSRGIETILTEDIFQPHLINFFKIGGFVNDVEISKDENTLFLSLEKRGIAIVDLTNITSPSLISSVKNIQMDKIVDITLSKEEKRLFAAGLKSGLFVIDITDLSNPKTIALSKIEGSVQKVIVDEDKNIAVIANAERGLQIVDIGKIK